MKNVLIAFDVDGTLRDNRKDSDMGDPTISFGQKPEANENIRTLLIILSGFKNVTIMVWSGGGESYARQMANALGISQYVDQYAAKNITNTDGMGVRNKHPEIQPDIAIDDIQDCILGNINLIVREK